MNIAMVLSASLVFSGVSLFAASPAKPAPSTKSVDTVTKVTAPAEKQILFFMNPNGRPCQMQLSVLDGMKKKLSGIAKVTYVKTTESSDQETFYKYGIRGLPSLIILDDKGKEIKRFTPGIQDEETIATALGIPSR
jgi:thiol-disulfide isomerase/thioredoxin